MASQIAICNLALAHLGDRANLSDLDEGSAQADHCSRFYSIARDKTLELHSWSFAKRRETLALLSDPPASEWAYAYQIPSGCLVIRAVLAEGATDDQTEDFDTEVDDNGNRIIFTNVADARAIFTKRVTDTSRFTPGFTDALARLLAAYLAGPIIKGDAGVAMAKDQYAAFTAELAIAKAADAGNSKRTQNFTPSNISARGGNANATWLAPGRIVR